MIRRFTSAQFVPANAGAKAKNPVGSTLFSTPMVALLRHSGHKILRTFCRESARKRLTRPRGADEATRIADLRRALVGGGLYLDQPVRGGSGLCLVWHRVWRCSGRAD